MRHRIIESSGTHVEQLSILSCFIKHWTFPLFSDQLAPSDSSTMGFLSLLTFTLFLSLVLAAPPVPAGQLSGQLNSKTDSTIPGTGDGTKPGGRTPPGSGTKLVSSTPPGGGTTPGGGTGTVLPPNLVRDRAIIQAFAKTVTVDPLGIVKTWQGDNPCKYKGFVCDKKPDTGVLSLAGVDFNQFHLRGKNMILKGFLDQLVDLAIFHANSNGFLTTVPGNLAQLPYLYELDFSNNKLSGSFPAGVLTVKGLTFLDVRFNMLTGSLPAEVFYPDLDVLFVNNNQLSGSISSELGKCRALYVTFANNQFSGSIPSEINNMEYIIEILFEHNQFTGSLPTDFGKLKYMTLFDASNNQLEGTIPESLCGLPSLKWLVLKNNKFTEDLGPICLKALQMNKLDVAGNCIKNAPNQRAGCGTGNDPSKHDGSGLDFPTRRAVADGDHSEKHQKKPPH
ncbi:hypothetical protein BKA81DRAFT_361167 [Phyllosticta paracitricarpa]